jgi:hypothetical protein
MADSPWDMWSAIGTLGAVFTALGLSYLSSRSSGKVATDKAELAAAKMLSPLSTLERKASYLSVCFAFSESDFSEPGANVLKALEELEVLSRGISIEDLYPLLKLPSHAAKRSARALGLIQTFASETHALLTHSTWIELESAQKAFHYNRWAGMLDVIKDHLVVAVSACESAASTGAPRPSPEEVYGGAAND